MLRRLKANIKETISNRLTPRSADLRSSTDFSHIGPPSPLIRDMFELIKDIPGWFNVDDCGHFALILSYQNAMNIDGDILEIGSYHGRSTAIMTSFLKASEKVIVCDAFMAETNDAYANKPTPEKLRNNIKMVNPNLAADRVVIHECLSNDLELASGQYLRFAHIDGGHSAEEAYQDLVKCSQYTKRHGVIVVDDYDHENWAGVTEGTERFLSEYLDFEVLADLNRHGASGRKLYIIRRR